MFNDPKRYRSFEIGVYSKEAWVDIEILQTRTVLEK